MSEPKICYFCKKPITEPSAKYPNMNGESLIYHSLDGNHDNWSPENKIPAHNKCHTKHHNLGSHNALGKHWTMREDGRKKISEALTGRSNPHVPTCTCATCRIKRHDSEIGNRISESKKGKPLGPWSQARREAFHSNLGKHWS